MSPANRLALASAAAVLSMSAFAISTASAAGVSHYQEQEKFNCPGGPAVCTVAFVDLPPNQALDLDHVVCQAATNGQVLGAEVDILPEPIAFNTFLALQWERTLFQANIFTLGADMNVRVPLGKQFEVKINVTGGSGALVGTCSATGNRITI